MTIDALIAYLDNGDLELVPLFLCTKKLSYISNLHPHEQQIIREKIIGYQTNCVLYFSACIV